MILLLYQNCFRKYRPGEEPARMAQIGNMLKALNGKVAGEALVHIGINKAKGK